MGDRFTGTDPDPITAGGTLTIRFSDGSKAGQTITVEVDNSNGDIRQVQVQLGADGKGSTTFVVPTLGWSVVNLNGPDSLEHSIQVQ